nr:MAG TPA: hypothetical protein [Caudoviricetes sp.]
MRLQGRGIVVHYREYLHGASPTVRHVRRRGGDNPRDHAHRPRSNNNFDGGGL